VGGDRLWVGQDAVCELAVARLTPKAGVAPRMAQELMRHSDIRLTMNTYTHLHLVDTAGAVEALPSINRRASAQPTVPRQCAMA
jgi:hypothetical protein